MTIEIGQNGEVTVPEGIKGTYADPTIPLHERVERLAANLELVPLLGDAVPVLLHEAADILQSNRVAAERRGKVQLQTQACLHNASLEITFLRNLIHEKLGVSPEFALPSPYETEARREAEGGGRSRL